MKIIQKTLKLNKRDYYVKNLKIMSNLLPITLTKKEIEILAEFMSLDGYIIKDEMFNITSRKKVMENLKLHSASLVNHLRSMIKKGILDRDKITNKISIKSYLIPEDNFQGYQIKIIKE